MYFGVISQIFKGKGEKVDRKNWRPITLLNVDFKFFAKIIFNRLKKISGSLVNSDQSCSIPGRNIRHGILTVFSVIEKLSTGGENGLCVSLNQKTAFDVVNWDFMFHVLKDFNISEKLLKLLRTFYKPHLVNPFTYIED